MKRASNPAPELSIVTPAFNEEKNHPLLYEQLVSVLDGVVKWEWIVIDDHSRDEPFKVLTDLAAKDSRVRGVRFTRNFGSHRAILCGLERMKGECAVVMAADLPDPPQGVPRLP